jgi:hypothetical protein
MSGFVLMVRPARFAFNPETAATNAFQSRSDDSESSIQSRALAEFDAFVALLRAHGIDVTVAEDTPEPEKPDAIFPNNWLSTHEDGAIFLFPMAAANRRLERRAEIVALLRARFAVAGERIVDLSPAELDGRFLEGTGSVVLDRRARVAYAALSPRTDEGVFRDFCARAGYRPVAFSARDDSGVPVYHTNVLLSVGAAYAILCVDAVDAAQREAVLGALRASGKEIVAITFAQMRGFAGNALELTNADGQAVLVMSACAKASLTEEQLARLGKYAVIIAPDLATIERHGGGSARCCLCEIALPLLPQ